MESCRQDLSEKVALVAEASQALENLEKQMAAQEAKHKEQLKMLEDKMSEMDLLPRFDLANVPTRKLIRSPDISRKPLASPKFGHKINFFQPDKEDFANNNKDTLSERLVLEVLEEGEETSDMEHKCEGHLKKIQELELTVASNEVCVCQVLESQCGPQRMNHFFFSEKSPFNKNAFISNSIFHDFSMIRFLLSFYWIFSPKSLLILFLLVILNDKLSYWILYNFMTTEIPLQVS